MHTKYIKSPLNYVGGKYKLLSQILPLFPSDITCFVDMFGGGFNVGINVECDKIIYNDKCTQVVDLLTHFYKHSPEWIHYELLHILSNYGLDRSTNCSDIIYKSNYFELRTDYNRNPNWLLFYALITCAFSNQIRFNAKEEFNMPYGKRYYNPALQKNLQLFIEMLQRKQIDFFNKDFRDCEFSSDTFLYCDPPYYNSSAAYNVNGGWSKKDEIDLLNYLDNVHKQHGKFALSNNLKYDNDILHEWKAKYHVHYLESDYSSCNYHKKDKSKDIEVLITNY